MKSLEHYKILVVDDSDFSRANIVKTLETENFNIIGEAGNAKEATQVLKEQSIDIAILDIVMPEVSGIELAQYISDNFKRTQIIMVSSLAGENIIMDAIAAGASDYLQKPFKAQDLISAVGKAITQIEMEA